MVMPYPTHYKYLPGRRYLFVDLLIALDGALIVSYLVIALGLLGGN